MCVCEGGGVYAHVFMHLKTESMGYVWVKFFLFIIALSGFSNFITCQEAMIQSVGSKT